MIEPYIQLFGFIVRTVAQSRDIVDLKISGLEDYMDSLDKSVKSFKKFCKHSSLIAGGQMGGEPSVHLWFSQNVGTHRYNKDVYDGI